MQVALRTQQIIAHESGVADTVDPLAGSYAVEALTDEIERRAEEYIRRDRRDGRGARRHRARLLAGRDPGSRLPRAEGGGEPRADGGRASTSSPVGSEPDTGNAAASIRRSKQRQKERLAALRAGATAARGGTARPAGGRRARKREPDADHSWHASRRISPWARFAARCATSGANTVRRADGEDNGNTPYRIGRARGGTGAEILARHARPSAAGESDVPEQASRIAFLPLGGGEVELVQPTTENSGMAKFLQKRGPGFHHVCFEMDDLDGMVDRLKAKGIRLIGRQAVHRRRRTPDDLRPSRKARAACWWNCMKTVDGSKKNSYVRS